MSEFGMFRYGSLGELCLGSARRGLEWHRQGRAVQAVFVLACRGLAGKGQVWRGSRGCVRLGNFRHGQVCYG